MLLAATSDLLAFSEKMNVFQKNREAACSLHSLDTYIVKTLLLLK